MPASRDPGLPILSLRQLNRALLARQMLLRRARVDVPRAIERLGALQAQWPRAPYVGLWSRLAGFERGDLEQALEERRVVKATLMRGTLHLVSASDYAPYVIATRSARRDAWPSTQRQLLNMMARTIPEARSYVAAGGSGIRDGAALHDKLLRFTRRPRSRDEVLEFIVTNERIPAEVAAHLVWNFIAGFAMVVHEPASALFSASRAGRVQSASVAIKGISVPTLEDASAHTVRRYLAAFGPSTVDDISSWTSMRTPPIREALAAMGRDIRTFADERGRTLYDLARAPRPAEDEPAPPRFLPKWDSTLLAYTPAERVRILPATHHKSVIIKNGDVAQTFLVDGMVAGTWAVAEKRGEALVELEPFTRVSRADRAALLDEGERLARFLKPDAKAHGARV